MGNNKSAQKKVKKETTNDFECINDCGIIINNELLVYGYSRRNLKQNNDLTKIILAYFHAKIFMSDTKAKHLLKQFNNNNSIIQSKERYPIEIQQLMKSQLYIVLVNNSNEPKLSLSDLISDSNSYIQLLICIMARKCGMNLIINDQYFHFSAITNYYNEITVDVNQLKNQLKDKINLNNIYIQKDEKRMFCFNKYSYKTLDTIKGVPNNLVGYRKKPGFGFISLNDIHSISYVDQLRTILNEIDYIKNKEFECVECIEFHIGIDDGGDFDPDFEEGSFDEYRYNFVIIPVKTQVFNQYQFLFWSAMCQHTHTNDEF